MYWSEFAIIADRHTWRGYHAVSLNRGSAALSWIAIALLVVGVFLFIKIAAFAFRMAILVGIVLVLYWLFAPMLGLPTLEWSGTKGIPQLPF